MTVYPNPLPGGAALTINLAPPSSDVVVEVYNMLGQVVLARSSPPRQFLRLDTQSLASGVYLARITGDTWETTRSVVVLR